MSEALYDNSYFENRNFEDKKRLKSFEQEKVWLQKYIQNGMVCDIGCSTGEFLSHIEWNGDKYGMEVNDKAIKMAQENGISFDKNILNQKEFFDLVIFRGTIQHVPNPFLYIQKSYESLKNGGFIVFLATPNMGSLYYKLFDTLPMLDNSRNFYIPSEKTLSNALKNFGFEVVEVEKPYITSPYANILTDHLRFIKKAIFRTNDKFAFWGNSMNIIARKIV
jgi:2-polyprenyl-3-methyl-5-hydroxy-6-metoxy-1,4-benzoquinol methylase